MTNMTLDSLNKVLDAMRQRDKIKRERRLKLSFTPTTVLYLYEQGRISDEEYKKYMLSTNDYQPKMIKE